MGQILAFVSGKGGTGKTTVCSAVACCLAAEGARVLCVDADVGLRNLDLSLGMTDICSVPFTELMRGGCDYERIPEHDRIPGLFLLTAPVTETPASIGAEEFRRFLRDARERFDFCLIDAPAGVGTMFRTVIAAADRAAVVANSDPASIRDAASVASLLTDFPDGSVRLIINRVVPKLISAMDITLDGIMDRTGLRLLGIVPEDPSVPLAAAAGTPLVFYTGKRSARACLNIARRLRGQQVPLMKIH